MVRSPIGKYSGNPRLDPKELVEPDSDNEFSKHLWLEEVAEDEEFLEEVKEEIDAWKKAIQITANPEKLDIHLVGQSHIDMAWKWRYEQTRQKGVITIKKAVEHAKELDDFSFALSQPILVEWLKEDAPDVYNELKEVVKKGNINLVGGSWVEPDCMMPSGEAFTRQRLYGMKSYKENFGLLPKVEWFLDSFGYNYGLPQILKKSGAEYFWTSKITWNRQTMFPFVNFWWESPDGTKLLTANFQQGWAPISQWMRFEIGRHPLLPSGKKIWNYEDEYEDIDEAVDDDPENIVSPLGIFFGKGDGGHGPTHQEVAFAMAATKLGFGHWSTADKFFEALEPYGEKLPIWADELYLEYHRGTFTVHFEVKRHNRWFENRLVAVESLAAILAIANKDYLYPVERLEQIWKTTLLNQFHDCLPGSSIPEVYDDLWDMWQEGKAAIDALINEWAAEIKVPWSTDIILTNPLAIKRRSPVFIPITIFDTSVPLDENGLPPYLELIGTGKTEDNLIAQPIAAEEGDLDDTHPAGWWTILELPPLGGKTFKTKIIVSNDKIKSEITKSEIKAEISENIAKITNGIVSVELDKKTGAIISLTSQKVNDGKNILKGDQNNLTLGFLDDYPTDHAWNIKPQYWKFPLDIPNDKNVSISIKDNGPIFSTLQVKRTLGEGEIKPKLEANSTIGANDVIQEITLFSGCQEIFLKYEADWKQPWLMLKVVYDTTTNAEYSVSDQCYCAIKRSTKPETHCDQARYEKIMHKYVDLSTPDNKWGLALLNEGKYAYDTMDGKLRLTMLRTPVYPDTPAESFVNKERKIRKEAGLGEPPQYVDLGFFRCRYALLPHKGSALLDSDGNPNANVKLAAEKFNSPVLVVPAENLTRTWEGEISPIVSASPIIYSEKDHVEITSIKQKEWVKSKNLILRAVEVCGVPDEDVKIVIHPEIAAKIKEVKAVDLLERSDSNLAGESPQWDPTNNKISFKIGKFEIRSFELVLN